MLADRIGNAYTYRLNRGHLAAEYVIGLANLMSALLARLTGELDAWDPKPACAAVFGSAARGTMTASSDIDLLLVRPDGADQDAWDEQTQALASRVTRWTGTDARPRRVRHRPGRAGAARRRRPRPHRGRDAALARPTAPPDEGAGVTAAPSPCPKPVRTGRLRKAEQFFAVARDVLALADDDDHVGDAFVTLCVHAGIAASEVICCAALGKHAGGQNHNEAIDRLRQADKDSTKYLKALLDMKTKSGYTAIAANALDIKRATRAAAALIEAACLAHASAG